jgi:hypothetical protein
MTDRIIKLVLLYFLIIPIILGCSNSNFGLQNENVGFLQAPLYNNKVDVLIMVDDSSSMQVYQNSLAGQIMSMVAALNALRMDYHFAVTTSSVPVNMNSGSSLMGGRFVGIPAYFTNSTPNLQTNLPLRLKRGYSGSDLEQGILSVQTALSPANLTGAGAGFLRDDAFLAIIYLSNDTDYSNISPADHIAFLNKLKKPFLSGAKSWVVNFLGVSTTSTCSGAATGVGIAYLDLVTASDGVFEDICSADWTKVVTNVQVRINQLMTDFYLNKKPILSSISVMLNGKSVAKLPIGPVASGSNGWTYEERIESSGVTKYFIRFHGNIIPALYDSIDIKYDPAGAT